MPRLHPAILGYAIMAGIVVGTVLIIGVVMMLVRGRSNTSPALALSSRSFASMRAPMPGPQSKSAAASQGLFRGSSTC